MSSVDPTTPTPPTEALQALRAEWLVTPDGVEQDALVTITGGRITDVTRVPQDYRPGPGSPEPQVLSGWVVPGFVDTHVHGGGGADYATNEEAEALRARSFHRTRGTTTSLASLVTADLDTLGAQLATLRPLVESGELAGVHLEGPFLSEAKKGAHEPRLLRAPDAAAVDSLLAAGEGILSMITIAPELPGGLAAIERVAAAGVVAAVGHTDADETMIKKALDAGATVATHLFNAMRPIHHREPGPIPALLSDPRMVVELICDGFHLHPDVIAMAVEVAGADHVALVTDAMAAAGMADGSYRIGDLQVQVTDSMARLVEADGSLGSIAGSTLTMAGAFELLVQHGVSIPAVAIMASTTPARVHALAGAGAIAAGQPADLCLVDDHGRLQRVMQAGAWVSTETEGGF